jgi:hypothetical protein
MKTEHVIYLSSAGNALWSWHRTRFVASAAQVGVDPEPIAEQLRRLEPGPIAVLVDMLDEEYFRDGVPRLGRRDQRAILDRKLARTYPRTQFRAAFVQGRSTRNADEDQVLLSALTRPDPVSALLATLAAAKLPVAGVFSPALLSAQLLDASARAASAAMLVLRRSNGRIQHSFFRNGRLAGSRRLGSRVGADETALMHRQIEESLRYFDPTFSVSPDNPLQVVTSSADSTFARSTEQRPEGWHFRLLDVSDLRKRFRISPEVQDIESERLFIELLRAHAPAVSFARVRDTRYFEFFRARKVAGVACWTIATAAMAGTLNNALDILDARRQRSNRAQNIEQLQAVLPATYSQNSTGVDPLEMQRVVSTYDELRRHQLAPAAILSAIGTALNARPRIHIDGIEWSTGAAENPVNGEPLPTAGAANDDVTITLRGMVKPFAGDYPQAFDELAAFEKALKTEPAVKSVTVVEQPLDIRPSSTLNVELAADHKDAEAAFSLRITMSALHESI